MIKTLTSQISYEEERSQIDFDDVVRQNQEKYRGETKLSNEQVEKTTLHDGLDMIFHLKVLDNIAREEGEDRPNISQLLAWAKGDKTIIVGRYFCQNIC